MFKKGDQIIYPVYGISQIKGIISEQVGDKTVKCYEIIFLESQLTISVPVDRADSLGLRYPLKRNELKESLKNLYKKAKATEEDLLDLEKYYQNKLRTGAAQDAIELINTISKIARDRSKEERKLSMSESENLKRAKQFLGSEVGSVLGKKALAEYKLFEVYE